MRNGPNTAHGSIAFGLVPIPALQLAVNISIRHAINRVTGLFLFLRRFDGGPELGLTVFPRLRQPPPFAPTGEPVEQPNDATEEAPHQLAVGGVTLFWTAITVAAGTTAIGTAVGVAGGGTGTATRAA